MNFPLASPQINLQYVQYGTVESLYSGHHGTQLAILCGEVSLIQRNICTQLCVVGTADTVLIGEVAFTQSVNTAGAWV